MSTREQANLVASEKMTQMDSKLNQIKVNSSPYPVTAWDLNALIKNTSTLTHSRDTRSWRYGSLGSFCAFGLTSSVCVAPAHAGSIRRWTLLISAIHHQTEC